MNILSKKAMLGLLSIAVLSGGMLVTGQAKAMCVYNHANHRVKVLSGYSSSWMIYGGDHRCTDGTGGDFSFQIVAPDDLCVSDKITLKVDDHGWASVFGEANEKWKVESKDSDGNVKETKYLNREAEHSCSKLK